MTTVVLALVGAQLAPQPTPAASLLSRPFSVAQTVRLAITPTLDGRLDDEEWDRLSADGGAESGFQWEPEVVYWSARAKDGEDVVLSLDEAADGWLVGSDNLEFRVSFRDGAPSLSVRRLDGTQPNGPVWLEAAVPASSVTLSGAKGDDGWVLEGAFRPAVPLAPAAGRRLGLRVDAVPMGSDLGPAFMPRPLAFVSLQTDMGQALPTGFRWRPETLVRDVPVEDEFKVRYAFERAGAVEFEQLEYRVEGSGRDAMAAGTQPFPTWNSKGRAAFDYASRIRPDTRPGYRVLRTSLRQPDGSLTVLRSSFQVAELVDFKIDLPRELPPSPEARIVKGHVVVRSNGMKRVNGRFSISVPEEWTVSRGSDVPLTIYHSRGSARIPVEIIVPKDTVGTFPVKVEARIGDRIIAKTVYVPVGRA